MAGGPAFEARRFGSCEDRPFRARAARSIASGPAGLWERHLQLDSEAAQQDLGIRWTPYAEALEQSAAWYLREERGSRARAVAVLGKDLTN